MKDKFENNIKTLLDSYEADFNPADWADMNKRLDSIKPGKNNVSKLVKNLLIAASAIIIAGVIYYMNIPKSTNELKTNTDKGILTSPLTKETAQPSIQQSERNREQQTIAQEDKITKEVSFNDKVVIDKTQKEVKNINPNQENKVSKEVSTTNQNIVSQPEIQPTSSPVVALQQPVSELQDKAPVLSASFSANTNKACEGAPIQFTVKEGNKDNSYKWYFGDGETSVEPNPTHIYKSKGNYTVRLKVTDKTRKSDEQKNIINVVEAPSIAINFNNSEDSRTFNFESDADRNTEVKWDFGDAKISTEENPVHSYAKYGSYKVTLTAKNSVGCTSILTKDIKVENIVKLFAPNAFSPDGDNLNDTWIPEISGEYNVVISIQDMNGNIVYTTANGTPWDGVSIKTGEKVKEGNMFTWTAIIKDKQGNISRDKGNITIK